MEHFQGLNLIIGHFEGDQNNKNLTNKTQLINSQQDPNLHQQMSQHINV